MSPTAKFAFLLFSSLDLITDSSMGQAITEINVLSSRDQSQDVWAGVSFIDESVNVDYSLERRKKNRITHYTIFGTYVRKLIQ